MSKNPFVQMDTIEGSGEGVWGDEPQEKGAKKKSKMKNPFDLDASDGEEEEKKAKGEGGRRMGDGNEKLPVTYPVRKGLDTFDEEVNVVLVGNMGVGKSTLGNYLFNMGDKKEALFETSADPTESCSKRAQVKSFGVEFAGKRVQMNIMDTPGLSELKPAEDLKHTIGLFEEAIKMTSVTMVVLVAGLQNRFDRQTVDTMLYYRNLFLPVFECGNVCLAIPNFSQRRLEELIDEELGGNEEGEEEIEVEEVVRGTLDKWRNECESKLGIRLAACRFFESWTTNGIRKRESKKFLDGLSSRTVDRMTIESRNLFLAEFIHSRPVSLSGHLFALPPVIEEMRLNRLEKVKELLEEVEGKSSLQSQLHSDRLEGLGKQSKEIVNKLLEISVMEDDMKRLQGTIRSGSVYCDGDDRVVITKSQKLTLWSDLKDYTLQAEKWNCDYEEVGVTDNAGKTQIQIRISPDMVNVRTKQITSDQPRKRWFCKVWAEWSGEESNAEELKNKQNQLTLLKVEAEVAQKELEDAQAALSEVSEEVRIFLEHQSQLQKELLVVSKERYAMEEACEALSIFAKKDVVVKDLS